MDKLEKIKIEYMVFEEENAFSTQDVHCLLELYHSEMNDSIKTAKHTIKQNSNDYKIGKFKSIIGDLLGYEVDYEFFLEDSKYLYREVSLAKKFDNYFIRLCEKLDDDNFLDISRLAQFSFDKCLSNYNYIESLRDSVIFSTSGIVYYGAGESDVEEFNAFFEEEFNNILNKDKKDAKVFVKTD